MRHRRRQLECKRCGHAWWPRGHVVHICPKCKSPRWYESKTESVTVNSSTP